MLNLMATAAALWMLAMPQIGAIPDQAAMPDQKLSEPRIVLIGRKALPQFLKSGDNDLIVIHSKKSGASRPDIVQVCIASCSTGGGRKAFDNHRATQPRYVAGSGQTDCGNVHPTRQDFFFWKAAPNGAWKPVLKQKLNLSGYAGYSIRFEWVDD